MFVVALFLGILTFGHPTEKTWATTTYTGQEQANIQVVKGFFQAFGKELTSSHQYIDAHFTPKARFIFTRGGEELYAKDQSSAGEPPPKTIKDTNDYSDERFSHERYALVPLMREYIGPAGVKEFLTKLKAEFDFKNRFTSFKDLKYIAENNNVAVYGYLRYVNKKTGNFLRTPFAVNIELVNGKINLYHYYEDSFAHAAASRQGGSWQGQYGLNQRYDLKNPPYLLYVQWGTRNADNLTGDKNPNQLADQIYGYQNDDSLNGGEGDDKLWGGSGRDILLGGNGDDILYGNIGFDTLTGGAGSDTFVLASDLGIAKPGEQGFDTIADFEDGVDRLGLDNGLADSVDGKKTSQLTQGITFNNLKIAQEGADTWISIADTGEKLALLKNVDANKINAADFITLEQFPAFRGYPEDSKNPGNEAQNRAVVEGFYNAFRNGTIADYISNNFAQDAQYTPIQGDNQYFEIYNPDIDAYSVSFSQERFLLTPSTREWNGIAGDQQFIADLVDANNTMDPITSFFPEKFVVHGDDIGVFGRFIFRNATSGQISDTPFAYHIQLKDNKIHFIHFFEDSYSYTNGTRQGGTWTQDYGQKPLYFTFGTRLGDSLTGESGSDQLYGYQANDRLTGKQGDDFLYGGQGNDTFVLAAGEGTDKILDFEVGQDRLELSGGLTFEQLSIAQNGSDTLIKISQTQEVLAILKNVKSPVLDRRDFLSPS
ncbi:MAG: calcium-binding protein [Microcystis sp. M53600_WE12]|nr:calcium-binding protein [Microcystis sp. M53600_WE12]